ncbi:hypothetical protein HPHPH21_1042 [Helicobacter pylori Hp H-21]|uniref:Uncharacterized protein n=1 Tax=Helicobacter pylori Hp P-4 TaxID=992075 RepID=J0PRG7_HELPX|nr:hypothetical protein HPHPH21_1042 [Helicobacter pylori Hp H-21]EJC01243.1 hypothetical protein HPHPP4_1251 [Helicobacter pylori Hp P-4]EJC22369.1 hypothetical protein HPHPP4D_1463 [Helicobacter pylori Hp P-4d]EJC23081.1 hypothetical protein HPHPP4C_1274 [Helicobacter pylori Hp P-4c]EJC51123.1 hypothetical protein HPHPP41_1132 [Helicobacter pylori Hp P-41]
MIDKTLKSATNHSKKPFRNNFCFISHRLNFFKLKDNHA